ncbi:MAG: GAF domain-containing protein, partial [Flavobacteriales bacterium]|nr:GAF domain-containing protein [Flavobacteriales bacterium]
MYSTVQNDHKEEPNSLGDYLALMREIGGDFASISNHAQMIDHIYEKVNLLMDVSVLAVSYYDADLDKLVVPCTIEKGEVLIRTELDLNDSGSFAVSCYVKNQEIIINDLSSGNEKHSLDVKNTHIGEAPASLIYIPLVVKGHPIGTIAVQSFKKNAYSGTQVELLRILASYTSICIENIRAIQQVENQVKERTVELQTMNDRISVLNEIGYSLSSVRTIEEISEIVYRDLSKLMKVDGFGLGIYNEFKQTIDFDRYIEDGELLSGVSYGINEDRLSHVCFKTLTTYHINQHAEVNQYLTKPQELKFGKPVESRVYTPLVVEGRCIGVLTVQAFSAYSFSTSDVKFVKSLSAFVASALSNVKLFEHVKLLSVLGKEVTSTFDVVEIADKLYFGLEGVIDTSIFILSGFEPISRDISYLRFYENGELLGVGEGHNIDETESFAGWCVKNKKPILIGAQEEFKNYIDRPLTGIGDLPHSLICLPLIYENECLGTLTVQSFEKSAYSGSHVELLMTISSSLAVAMNNAKIHEDIEGIAILGTQITGMVSIKEISELLYNELQSVMPSEGFGIGFYNPLVKGLEFAHYIEDGEFLENHIDPIDSERVSAICFNAQKTIHTGTAEDFKQFLPESYIVEYGEDTISIIYVPLMHSSKCLGVITVQSVNENQFSKSDVQLLENLAPYVAVAIDSIISYENLRSLSEIGQEISSTLDTKKIADELYGQLTNLLDAFTFLLASYNSSKGIVEYIRVYENGNRIAEGVSYSINKRETLATYSILNNEVIHISESEEVDNYVNRNITYDGVPHESIIYIPIVFQGEILGVFSVQSQKKNAYTKYHVEVMKTIGAYLGVAFNNSLSHSQLKVINELGQEITAKTDPIDVLYVAYDRLSEVVELNGFGIGVHNSITNSIEYPGFIEAGEVLKSGSQSLEIKTPSTYCFI